MEDAKKYSNIDFYGLLELDQTATEAEVRKAYRRKALQCHPDKNPDNPRAAELFHELSKALEILTDKAARNAYDKVLSAKKAAEIRNRQLDSKRQKLKADLEKREKEASTRGQFFSPAKTAEETLRDEIERLRKEGSKLLEEEQELMRNQIREELLRKETSFDSSKHRIKIKWKAGKTDPDNGNYNEDSLRKYLQKYGEIVALVLSSKKNGSALVEFKTAEAAEMAVTYEKGNLANPLTLEWVSNPPSRIRNVLSYNTTVTDSDFESLVLRQMRQAEERKRLIEQMMNEDKKDSNEMK
uniref:DnaJ homolog subfamily C member 17 n=1 Tax=Tabanus bromius TaxID=304241 RepID=A0A0K8TM17_TABBR